MDNQEHIKVLLIEDNPDDAEIIRRLLSNIRSISMELQWASDLPFAFKHLASERFDVVVTDLGLPECGGLESFLKLHAQHPGIPVIVLTGLSDEKLALQAVRSGAQDYLVKGKVDSPVLLKSILHSIERQRMLSELEDKLCEIRRLERERKSILSMFAHDIKNAIIPSSLLLKRIISGKTLNLTVDIAAISENLVTAEDLLSDFMEFSRFETREYLPAKGDFDIRAEVLKQVSMLTDAQKNVKLACSFPEEPLPVVSADKNMMRRVIANLIHNAVKYTDPGGTVNIGVQSSGGELLVQVRDSGIGIPEEHQQFIFDAFYRVSDDQRGSGLGLAIARTIIEAHDGNIRVESRPGAGSTFTFTLPL
jgi:signal transduction histidine kinase